MKKLTMHGSKRILGGGLNWQCRRSRTRGWGTLSNFAHMIPGYNSFKTWRSVFASFLDHGSPGALGKVSKRPAGQEADRLIVPLAHPVVLLQDREFGILEQTKSKELYGR